MLQAQLKLCEFLGLETKLIKLILSDIDIEGPVGEAGHKEGAWEEESANLVDPAEEKLQLDQQSDQNYQE